VTDFVSKSIPHNARVHAQWPFHKQLRDERKDGRLWQSVCGEKKLPEFHYDLPQTHVASSICLSATIFQNPEGTF
jgi:hypothetical protein